MIRCRSRCPGGSSHDRGGRAVETPPRSSEEPQAMGAPRGSPFSRWAKPDTVGYRMTVEPALAALGRMDAAWKDAYEAALPKAAAFVAKLPLVRVVVPHRDPRKGLETDDVLRDGKLSPSHKS